MPEETERPDETVLRRLREADTGNDTRNLRSYVVGGVEASQLDYEDWVRPLKLTGGRVCLRLDYPDDGPPEWLRRTRQGILEVQGFDVEIADEASPNWVKNVAEDPDITLTPVPVEATPFAEADP